MSKKGRFIQGSLFSQFAGDQPRQPIIYRRSVEVGIGGDFGCWSKRAAAARREELLAPNHIDTAPLFLLAVTILNSVTYTQSFIRNLRTRARA
jgi:hypothetical protein